MGHCGLRPFGLLRRPSTLAQIRMQHSMHNICPQCKILARFRLVLSTALIDVAQTGQTTVKLSSAASEVRFCRSSGQNTFPSGPAFTVEADSRLAGLLEPIPPDGCMVPLKMS